MRFRTGAIPLCLVASLVLLATTAPASAAPKRITGKLSKPGYTVIALATNGKAKSVRAGRRRFTLRPPATRVTLHLRAPNGSYAGPVVVGRERKGRRAILGVRAGAKLGKVTVRRGYARVSRRPARTSIDIRRWARARRGIPRGAGNFGFVRSRPSRGTVVGDLDLDGVPNALDIDDDGDRVLDNLDRSPARAAQAESAFNVRSVLAAPLLDVANVNAMTTLTDAQIESSLNTTLETWGRLILEIMPGDHAELDCGGEPDPNNPDGWSGGRSYCTRGGTGTVANVGPDDPPHPRQWPPFPGPAGGEFDRDGDGFGTLVADTAPGAAFGLAPVAPTAQIGTGDHLIQHVTTGAAESTCPPPPGATDPACTEFPLVLPFVFASTPALVSYSDGQGNGATVSYPITGPTGPGAGDGDPGTDDNPFPVKADPDTGQVVVTLTFWRPQRRPIPGESGEWTDIGGLTYSAGYGGVAQACPQDAFSFPETELNLTKADGDVPYGPGAGGLRDTALDKEASPGNTLTYTLNLTQCLRGLAWNQGEARSFNFGAVDSAEGNVSVTETVPGVTFELQQP